MPGMGGLSTVLREPRRCDDRQSKRHLGNYPWEPYLGGSAGSAKMAGKTFLVNVTLNKHKQITGVLPASWTKPMRRLRVLLKALRWSRSNNPLISLLRPIPDTH